MSLLTGALAAPAPVVAASPGETPAPEGAVATSPARLSAEVEVGWEVQRAIPRVILPLRFIAWTPGGDGMLAVKNGRPAIVDFRGEVRSDLRCPGLESGESVVEGGLSPDGDFAAALLATGKVCVWGLEGAPNLLAVRARKVRHMAVGNGVIALTGDDGRIEVRDLRTGLRVWRRNYRIGAVTSMAFDRRGERMVVTASKRGAAVLDPRSGRLIRAFGQEPTWSASFDAKSERVAVGLSDGRVKVHETTNWKVVADIDVEGGTVRGLDFAEAGDLLAMLVEPAGGGEPEPWGAVWDFALRGEVFREALADGVGAATFRFSLHGDQLLGDSSVGRVWLWPRPITPWRPWAPALLNPPLPRGFEPGEDGYEPGPLPVPAPLARLPGAVSLSVDGARALVESGGGYALAPVAGGEPLALPLGETLADAPRWSGDGRRLLGRDAEGRVVLWDASTGAAEARLDVGDASFVDSARGRLVAIGASGQLLRLLPGQRAFTPVDGVVDVTAVAVDPVRSERLAVGRSDGTVAWVSPGRVGGTSGRRLVLGSRQVVALAFAPDGRRVAAAAVRLGGAEAGAMLAVLSDDAEADEARVVVRLDRAPRAVEWSDDGRRLMAWSDTDVTVADAATGAVHLSLQAAVADAHLDRTGRSVRVLDASGSVYDVAVGEAEVPWIPKGRRVAMKVGGMRTAVADGDVVELWQTEDGYLVGRLPPTGANVSAVAFSPTEKFVALRYADGDVETFDTARVEVVTRFSPPDAPGVDAAAATPWVRFSPDGDLLWSVVGPRSLCAWNVDDGALVAQVDVPGAGRLVADPRTRAERVVALYDADAPLLAPVAWVDIGGEAAKRLFAASGERRPIAARGESGLLAFADGDAVIRVQTKFGLAPSGAIRVPGTLPGEAAAFDETGEFLAVAWEDGVIRVFDSRGALMGTIGTVPPSLQGRRGGRIVGLQFEPGGQALRSLDDGGWYRRWDWRIGTEGARYPAPPGNIAVARPIRTAVVDSATRRIYSGHDDGIVRGWNLDTGEQVGIFADHSGPVRALATGGGKVVSAADDDTLRVLDAATLDEIAVVPAFGDRIYAVAIDAGGTTFAALGESGLVRSWDATTGAQLRRWRTEGLSAQATVEVRAGEVVVRQGSSRLVFTPATGESRLVIEGAADGLARLPEAAAAVLARFGAASPVLPADDGARWVAVGEDGRIRVWDAPSGALVATLTALTDGAWVVDRADGRRISSPSLRDQTAPPARLNPLGGPAIH